MIRYQCEGCGERLEVADQLAGRLYVCGLCGRETRVPGELPDTSEPPPPTDPEPPRRKPRVARLIFPVAMLALLAVVVGVPIVRARQDRIRAETARRNQNLQGAVLHGNVETVALLLDQGAEIECRDEHERTPLHLAAMSDYPAVVKLLLDRGADVNARNRTDFTPLHYAADDLGLGDPRIAAEVVKLLLDGGADVNAKCYDGRAPLHWALSKNTEIAKLLLAKGADVNAKDDDGKTPLHWAAGLHLPEAVKLLLDNGADVNARDNIGDTPLHVNDSGATEWHLPEAEAVAVILKAHGGRM